MGIKPQMKEVTVPVRYVGNKERFRDHLYGSGAEWEFGEEVGVPVSIAMRLLKHPEFEDARSAEDVANVPLKSLIGQRVPVTVEERLEELEPPLVDLGSLTKDQIVEHAQRYYGLLLDKGSKKQELIDQVRMRSGRNPIG